MLMRFARDWLHRQALTPSAIAESRIDRKGVPDLDPGAVAVIVEGLNWLGRAQDNSATNDNGVARHFSLVSGWGPSYPESTGYIVPTLIAAGRAELVVNHRNLLDRARRMLDWLVDIQMPSGAFQGGTVQSSPVVPVTFNTGQILLGLASGVEQFGDRYRTAMERAGDWLVATQDADGCWRKYATPFAEPGEKVYETHVGWGLVEAHRRDPNRGYASAALQNARWALGHQQSNGWFANCCLSDATIPLTHTIGYVLRGLIEIHRFTKASELLSSAIACADALVRVVRDDGFIPGQLDKSWNSKTRWACLTGSAQIVASWLLLDELLGQGRYTDAAKRVNSYVRRTIKVTGDPRTRGAVKGSFPISGDYGPYEFPNWAPKFVVDANVLELGGWQSIPEAHWRRLCPHSAKPIECAE
jgi:hypothetical protein